MFIADMLPMSVFCEVNPNETTHIRSGSVRSN